MKNVALFLAAVLTLCAVHGLAEETLSVEEMQGAQDAVMIDDASLMARQQLIDDIITLAKQTYEATGGRAQRAHYAGDIYVCKNFVTYLFSESCAGYRMAQYPDVPLMLPANLPREQCAPYVYGLCWQDVPAEEGNPFYAAATFRYDASLGAEENRELARAFLMQVQRGDFFQMAANYYYGVGAHSLIFIEDYDAQTDTVCWTDSNMKGETRGGERYGYVQFEARKEIDWFVDAFCRRNYGATLYRLREDIISVP